MPDGEVPPTPEIGRFRILTVESPEPGTFGDVVSNVAVDETLGTPTAISVHSRLWIAGHRADGAVMLGGYSFSLGPDGSIVATLDRVFELPVRRGPVRSLYVYQPLEPPIAPNVRAIVAAGADVYRFEISSTAVTNLGDRRDLGIVRDARPNPRVNRVFSRSPLITSEDTGWVVATGDLMIEDWVGVIDDISTGRLARQTRMSRARALRISQLTVELDDPPFLWWDELRENSLAIVRVASTGIGERIPTQHDREFPTEPCATGLFRCLAGHGGMEYPATLAHGLFVAFVNPSATGRLAYFPAGDLGSEAGEIPLAGIPTDVELRAVGMDLVAYVLVGSPPMVQVFTPGPTGPGRPGIDELGRLSVCGSPAERSCIPDAPALIGRGIAVGARGFLHVFAEEEGSP